MALVLDDQFPEEVLNEIRNALTHIARADALPVVRSKDAQAELQAAHSHIKRATIDCLKVSILATTKRAEYIVEILTEDLCLPDNVYQNMAELRKARQRISVEEGQYPTNNTIDKLADLLGRYDEFIEMLEKQFEGSGAQMRREARLARQKALAAEQERKTLE